MLAAGQITGEYSGLIHRTIISMILAFLGVFGAMAQEPVAQVPTETPALINLEPIAQQIPTLDTGGPTPTRTPTPQGVALLEAKEFANVRAEPSTESAQLGTIRSGEQYNVIGRYISWIQFEFPPSPTGRGWVFGELVNLSGNIENVPDIDPYSGQSQLDAASIGATSTQGVLTMTPGGVLTATAVSGQIAQPGFVTSTPEGASGILPTYTFPPGMVAMAPTSSAAINPESTDALSAPIPATNSNSVPPIAPILILGAVGLLGLVISSLRRG